MNKRFEELAILHCAIKDIDDIKNGGAVLKNSDNKLDAALNAIKDIDKNEIDNDCVDGIINLVRDGIVTIYNAKLNLINEEIQGAGSIGTNRTKNKCESNVS